MAETDGAETDFDELVSRLQELKKRQTTLLRDIRKLTSTLRNGGNPEHPELYLKALSLLQPSQIAQHDQTTVTRNLRRQVPNTDSFWVSLVERRRRKQLGFVPEKRLGIGKVKDMKIARALNVPTVETLYQGPWEDIPRETTETVVKPVDSSDSRGVFYLQQDRFYSVHSGESVDTWGEIERVAAKQIEKDPNDTRWELQTLVTWRGHPAPDLKFYAFYGEIGAVLEVSRHDGAKYAFFDDKLRPARFTHDPLPRMNDLSDSFVMNGDLDEAILEQVRAFSAKLPVPFLRIDYLGSDDGPVFCEFSSAPGRAHLFDKQTNMRLGKMYHEAELRLVQDLLNGKGFDEYMRHPVSQELRDIGRR